jgi:hypothetical protein
MKVLWELNRILAAIKDLVTSPFYQKGRQTGTAKTQEGDGGSFRIVLRQNLFSYQRANCLNYRGAVSFILPIRPLS